MEFDKVIEKRVSIRNYSSKDVPMDLIAEICESALHSPMAGNIFTPRLIIIDDPKKRADIAEAAMEQYFIADAPYLIIVCSDTTQLSRNYGEQAEKYSRQQAGAAIENMLLKITSLGLASCWIGAFDEEKIKDLLHIPEHIKVEAIIPVAYSSKTQKISARKKPDLKFITFFGKYGQTREKMPKRIHV